MTFLLLEELISSPENISTTMKKSQHLNIRVFPKTAKKLNAGAIPLYLKITINYTEAEFSLGVKIVNENEWDPTTRNVSKDHPQYDIAHTAICLAKASVEERFKELCARHEEVTPLMVKDAYLKSPGAVISVQAERKLTLTLTERIDQAVNSMVMHCQAVAKESKAAQRQYKEQRLKDIEEKKKRFDEMLLTLVREATIFFDNTTITKTVIHSLDEFMLQLVQRVNKDVRSFQTLRRWKVEKNKIKSFIAHRYNNLDLPLDAVRFKIAEQYYDYLTLQQEIGNNTAMKHVKCLKQVIERAVSNGWMTHNPLRPFRCTYEEPDQEGIVMHDIHALINHDFVSEALARTRDIFIFSCFTGYAYQDLAALSPSHVITGIDGRRWLQLNRGKTDGKEDVPILPIAENIIDKYRNHPTTLRTGKLLPVPCNSKYNRHLKSIGEACGIKRDLTTHVARHTFATTITLENDVPLATVQKMLGHRSIKTTEKYARVTRTKVSRNMARLHHTLFNNDGSLIGLQEYYGETMSLAKTGLPAVAKG